MCEHGDLLRSANFHLLDDTRSSQKPANPEANRSDCHFIQQAIKLINSGFLQHRTYDKTNTKHTASSRIFVLGSIYPY